MLKLSLDTTNSINICQEEIYHLTTAGSKVSLLLSHSLPPGRCRGSDWRRVDGFTSVALPPFALQILHIDVFMNKINRFVMISDTSSACSSCVNPVPRVATLKPSAGANTEVIVNLVGMMVPTTGVSLPVTKVLELLPCALPGCCFIIESSINNMDPDLVTVFHQLAPLDYNFLCFFYRNLNMAPLRKSFCSPKPQQAFSARQHDLVNPEFL